MNEATGRGYAVSNSTRATENLSALYIGFPCKEKS